MLKLRCPVQQYAWGRLGRDSCEVAALAAACGAKVDPELPYAELWMGTHPSGPALVGSKDHEQPLKAWLDNHPAALGDRCLQRFGVDLPFLFKVLSVQTALSIQSHPDKALAKKLHAEHPEVYKDGNHKPEMAIAISNDFKALCGFSAQAELSEALERTQELQDIIGSQRANALMTAHTSVDQKSALRDAFTALMTADATKVSEVVSKLVTRLKDERNERQLTPKEELVLELNMQYPEDVGVLSVFFLNLVSLKANEAIYLSANEPHAYISGELVECMATSDNVIRAGLTPKFRDTAVLCESLTYNQGSPVILRGEQVQEFTSLYSPPFEEFEVYCVHLPRKASTILPANQGPTILLALQGVGVVKAVLTLQSDDNMLQAEVSFLKGDVYFVPAGTSLEVAADSQDAVLWLAAVNSSVFSDTFNLQAIASTPPATVQVGAIRA